MGAWGEGPLENDTVADWFYEMDKVPIYSFIEEGLCSDDPYIVRGAAYLFGLLSQPYIYDYTLRDRHAAMAKDALAKMLDSEWIAHWNDRDAIVAAIKHDIAVVEGKASALQPVSLIEKILT
jgi:hypothetical protein